MKRIIVLAVIFIGVFSLNNDSFAKELSIGEMRSIGTGGQILNIHFRKMEGRNCLVDVQVVQNGKEVSSEKISFDWEKEEKYLSIGGRELLIFYVVNGVLAFLDDKEI